jgi:DNA polymerase-4
MSVAPEVPRAILHLDMDAFFVNVYLLEHPQDAGRPLVVGGSPDGRGVVAAASYEARAFGIQSAMPSRRARELCPDVKFVGHAWPRISECSSRIREILAEYGPLEPMSVDEAYVDLTGHPEATSMAHEVADRIERVLGLPASIGLGTSKLVAKVASDFEKPRGRTVVAPGEEAAFLAPLPVRRLHGIGPVTERKLAAAGVTTCGELAVAAPDALARAVGRWAEALRELAMGVDPRPVVPYSGPPRSVSSETTFDRDVGDPGELELALQALAEAVGGALRRSGLVARTVTVKFRLANFTTFTRQKTLGHAIDQDAAIGEAAIDIFRREWPRRPLRLLGVGVAKLAHPEERQLPLLPDVLVTDPRRDRG